MAFLNLLDRVGIVVAIVVISFLRWNYVWCNARRHGDIAAIQDFGPAVERVRVERDVVSAAETHFT